MRSRSLHGRIRQAAGALRGAQSHALAEQMADVAEALTELAAATDALLVAVEARDRLRGSVERHAAEQYDRRAVEAARRALRAQR